MSANTKIRLTSAFADYRDKPVIALEIYVI